MTPEEVSAFGESVAGVAAKSWGRAADAAAADLADLWEAGAALGWFGLGPENALDAALAAVRELGRAACPLPLMDGFVASRLLGGRGAFADRIGSGDLRVLMVLQGEDDHAAYLDAVPAATHVLALPRQAGRARLRPVTGHREQPGVAVPAWSRA